MPDNASGILGQIVDGPKGLSIRTKLAATLAGLVTLSLALMAAFILYECRQALLEEAIRRGLTVGRNLADYSASAVLQKDSLQAIQFTKDALSDDAVVHAVLTDDQGVVLAVRASSGRLPAEFGAKWQPLQGEPVRAEGVPADVQVVESKDPDSGASVLAFDFPVIQAGVTVGQAYIALSQEKIREVMEETTLKVVALAAVFVLLALISAVMLADVIVRPVKRLTRGALAVGGGDLDASVEVRSDDELGVLARTFNAMTQGLKRAQADLVEKELLQRDLSIAQEIQQGLLPKKIPQIPGYELAAFYAPAKEVGGDLYDFIPIDKHRMVVAVADVSGKSVPGSLGMAMTRSVLRAEALRQGAVGETLSRTNAVIQPDIRRGMFVTLFYAMLDSAKHTLTCANAGHNPAFLARHGRIQEIAPEGMALGLVPAAQFFSDELVVEIKAGDLVALYTDGVTEAMNSSREEYGEERFKAALIAASAKPLAEALKHVVDSVRAFVAGAPPNDDITLVLLRRRA
ncbi:MAG TPA: SpoIIE family protein phosphatase [bacterium]|jgi:serine phosphatase RsbU (regulator of sigma subunit)|nr:SpoIIE family protein phosphatase [bacterium]